MGELVSGGTGLAQGIAGYGGQGFSLRGEKDRFVLPPKLRNTIAERSGQRVLCIGVHEKWPCLTGFGKEREEDFARILDREERRRTELGQEFDRAAYMMNLWDFEEAPFDASGRFVLPAVSGQLGGIGNALYFQGAGDYITIWNPETLLAQTDPVFAGPQARCRAEMANAKGKGK